MCSPGRSRADHAIYFGDLGSLSGSDPYFVSNEPFTLSIQLPNPPVPFSSGPTFFSEHYTNGVFTLNGSPVAMTGSVANFYTFQSFSICLDSGCVSALNTFNGSNPLFSGSTSNPVFVAPGLYPTSNLGFAGDHNGTSFGSSPGVQSILISSIAASAPEPVSTALTGSGLFVIALGLGSRRAARK